MDFEFAEEEEIPEASLLQNWKILIADDDEDVHRFTKLALKGFSYEGRGIDFYDTFSGTQTVELLKNNDSIDLLLLDVIMDSDDDGLITVKKIREELKNTSIRIVLRTGQSGNAPERDVIVNYAIDDYKEKTELTSTKLLTTVVTSLRASQHIKTIERSREGLLQIIKASRSIFEIKSLIDFTQGVLLQLTSLLNISHTTLYEYEIKDSLIATLKDDEFSLIASSGKYDKKILDPFVLECLKKAYKEKESFVQDDVFVGYFEANTEHMIFLYIEGYSKLTDADKELLNIFYENIAVAFKNISKLKEIN